MEEKSFLPSNNSTRKETVSSKTWKLQRDQKRVSDKIEQMDTICQAAEIILATSRFSYLIYSSDFGHELNQLIGKEEAYVRAEAPRLIREALLADDRIRDVKEFSFSRCEDGLNIRFKIECVWGDFQKEVII